MSDTATDRVADAPSDNWVYRLLPKRVWPYAQLARWDRPIGWWLLLWPCWWSLALSVSSDQALDTDFRGIVDNPVMVALVLAVLCPVFMIGAIVMRGAGCTYNDIIDVDIDSSVSRTASRPIPSGRITKNQAWVFLVVQIFMGLIVLLTLSGLFSSRFDLHYFALGCASLIVVAMYPFAKRVTYWPQLVLGLAFSWGALMGWGTGGQLLSTSSLLLYAGCILWVIGYDTIYAHQDKEDDALIGVKSTARLFGDKTKPVLIALYAGTLVLFATAFAIAHAGWPSYVGLAIGCGHMIWQINALDIDDPENCLALFKSNKTFGWVIFAGLVADLFI